MVYIGLCLWMGGLRCSDHGRPAGCNFLLAMEHVKIVKLFVFQEDCRNQSPTCPFFDDSILPYYIWRLHEVCMRFWNCSTRVVRFLSLGCPKLPFLPAQSPLVLLQPSCRMVTLRNSTHHETIPEATAEWMTTGRRAMIWGFVAIEQWNKAWCPVVRVCLVFIGGSISIYFPI